MSVVHWLSLQIGNYFSHFYPLGSFRLCRTLHNLHNTHTQTRCVHWFAWSIAACCSSAVISLPLLMETVVRTVDVVSISWNNHDNGTISHAGRYRTLPTELSGQKEKSHRQKCASLCPFRVRQPTTTAHIVRVVPFCSHEKVIKML